MDALLYEWFPNRLPGEMDHDLDILRFWRMVQAKRIMQAEDDRKGWLSDGSKAPDSKASAAVKQHHQDNLAMWLEHDRLIAQFGLDAGG